jgi:hypothetical protein
MRGWLVAGLMVMGCTTTARAGVDSFFKESMDGDVVGAWAIDCGFDTIEENKICTIYKNQQPISSSDKEFLRQPESFMVQMVSMHQDRRRIFIYLRSFVNVETVPASISVLRVDKNQPIRTVEFFDLRPDSVAIKQMLTGQKIQVRWTKWPEGLPIDVSFSLKGFAQAYEAAKRALTAGTK